MDITIHKKLTNLKIDKRSYPELESLILIGSRSRNDYRDNSDVDLVVVFNDVSVMDYDNLENTIFHYETSDSLKRDIVRGLGNNPKTNKQYEVELIGSYELRKFKPNSDIFKQVYYPFKIILY